MRLGCGLFLLTQLESSPELEPSSNVTPEKQTMVAHSSFRPRYLSLRCECFDFLDYSSIIFIFFVQKRKGDKVFSSNQMSLFVKLVQMPSCCSLHLSVSPLFCGLWLISLDELNLDVLMDENESFEKVEAVLMLSLIQFLNVILQNHKCVPLEDLAAEFKLRTQVSPGRNSPPSF